MNKQQNHEKVEGSVIGTFIQKSMNAARVQVPRADELSRTVQAEMADRLLNTERKSRRQTKLAVMGIPSDSLASGDQRYARCMRLAASYRKVRNRELQVAHGYVSAGASALLSAAALALASSRFLYEKATEAEPETVAGILKQASALSDSARANELAAWELCAREAVQRKKTEAAGVGVPWIVSQAERKDKPSRGRPRKELPSSSPISSAEAAGLMSATVLGGGTDGQIATIKGPGQSQGVE